MSFDVPSNGVIRVLAFNCLKIAQIKQVPNGVAFVRNELAKLGVSSKKTRMKFLLAGACNAVVVKLKKPEATFKPLA